MKFLPLHCSSAHSRLRGTVLADPRFLLCCLWAPLQWWRRHFLLHPALTQNPSTNTSSRMDRAGLRCLRSRFPSKATISPPSFREEERQPSGYYSPLPLPSVLILEAADLRTESRYDILQLLTVYLENRGPFTAHSKAPSPSVQIHCRGAWQLAHVNKINLCKIFILDPVPKQVLWISTP